MAQNIYDDPSFFDDYSRLERLVEGLAGAGRMAGYARAAPGPARSPDRREALIES